jgi:hypothetical protein
MKLHTSPLALTVAAVAVAATLLVLPEAAYAQLPDFGKAQTQVETLTKSIVGIIRYLLIGFCVVLGLWEAFKASKGGAGGGKGWLTALLLFIVAGIAIAPAGFLRLIGLDGVAGELSKYGL